MTNTEIRTQAIFNGMSDGEVATARAGHVWAAERAPNESTAKHRYELAHLCTVELNRRATAAYEGYEGYNR